MRLESLNPLERIAYVAKRRSHGDSLDPFGVLATTQVQRASDPFESVIRVNVAQLLAPLLVLEAFATATRKKLDPAAKIYVLSDSAVIGMAEEAGLVPEQSWNVHLETLACTGLIFRFPVALKFGYHNSPLTQVRSNSWGNLAFERFELNRKPAFHTSVSRIESIVENYLDQYIQLIKGCQSEVSPLDVSTIHTLNNIVPIPIVT